MIQKIDSFILILVIICLTFLIGYFISDKMIGLPKGKIVKSEISFDKKHTMNAYFIYGGPISADAIRVEIVDNDTHKKRNIYWKDKENSISIKWLDNNTVEVNGRKINIFNDYYYES